MGPENLVFNWNPAIEPEHVDLCSLDGFFFALKVWWLQSQGLDDRPWTVAAKLLERGAKGKLVRHGIWDAKNQ